LDVGECPFLPESSRRRVMATIKFIGGVPKLKDKLLNGTVKRGYNGKRGPIPVEAWPRNGCSRPDYSAEKE
jgi:hypothetical protein